jgi:AbrB family looped-hinge helix DNA binding protein
VESSARLTSKGQITVPKEVRDALGISEGDRVVFRVDGPRAVMARTPDLLELAGSIQVPTGKRGMRWDDIAGATHRARARKRA